MRRMNKVCIVGMLAFMVALTGCGKQEINYTEESTTEDIQTALVEEDSVVTVEDLKIDDEYKWKETIETGGEPINVDAELRIDIKGELSTLELEEHYYSAEEKKRVLEYFFEPDSIRVDRDTYPTKELLQKKLEQYEKALEEEQSDGLFYLDESEVTMISNEKTRLTNLINAAPSYDEVAEEINDYNENYYKGTINGLEYSLTFDMNEEENRSGWTLEAKDYNDFVINENSVITWQPEFYSPYENQCTMTQEEVIDYADNLCKELGFTDMKPWQETQHIIWYLENGEKECNGYYVGYTLDMNGRALWPFPFGAGVKWGGYIDDTVEMSFDEAKITFLINDTGIISMECKGIITKGKSSSVKVLNYEQIKECFRTILKQRDINDEHYEWTQLIFCYARVTDLDNPNVYRYIPVWMLDNIMLNAIDGTQIDMDTQVYVHYNTPEEWLESYQHTVLTRERVFQ